MSDLERVDVMDDAQGTTPITDGSAMTRETKVGLLVGLGVILLVGIILTDHLAIQAPDDPAPLLQIAPQAQQSMAPPPVEQDRIAEQEFRADNPPSRPIESPQAPPADSSHRPRTVWSLDDQAHRPDRESSQDDNVGRPAREPAAQVGSEQVGPARHEIRIERKDKTPSKNIYYVKSGDSLYAIAQREYGHGKFWKRIHDANPKAVKPDGDVNVGVRLVIPPRPQEGAAGPHTPTAPTEEYTVKIGDTLWRIAQNTLGDGNRYHEIFETNRDRLINEHALAVGQTLRLPR